MKIIGIVPARMAASRFPGKPLHKILGRPMIEHCFLRARLYSHWDGLFVATCDHEIKEFADAKGFPVLITKNTHTRALDRVAEAAVKCGHLLSATDIVVCVQADEPLLGPDVIEAVIKPLTADPGVQGTMLAVPIIDEETFFNPDIVKIVHDLKGDALYTSRAPIPYCQQFTPELGAKRVGGVFAFRWKFLQWFAAAIESPLEIKEACDSNRICDNGFRQRAATIPYRPYVSVDSPADIGRVEAVIKCDPLWGKY